MTRISSFSFSLLFVFLVSASSFAMLATPASAHTLAVEGEVGATLHIDPADEPVAGNPSILYFDFKNSEREFDSTEYTFVLSISQNGSAVATTSLFGNGETGATASYSYTFPQEGNYVITVAGTPKDGDESSTFTFDTHVSPSTPVQKNSIFAFLGVHGGHVLITVILVAILVIVVGYERLKENKAKKKGKG